MRVFYKKEFSFCVRVFCLVSGFSFFFLFFLFSFLLISTRQSLGQLVGTTTVSRWHIYIFELNAPRVSYTKYVSISIEISRARLLRIPVSVTRSGSNELSKCVTSFFLLLLRNFHVIYVTITNISSCQYLA